MDDGVFLRRVRDTDTWREFGVAVIAAMGGCAILARKLNASFYIHRVAGGTRVTRSNVGIEANVITITTFGLAFLIFIAETVVDGKLFRQTIIVLREKGMITLSVDEDPGVQSVFSQGLRGPLGKRIS